MMKRKQQVRYSPIKRKQGVFGIEKSEPTIKGKPLLCPICKSKTRTRAFMRTKMTYYPLYCHMCKNETLVDVENLNVTVIKEPDA